MQHQDMGRAFGPRSRVISSEHAPRLETVRIGVLGCGKHAQQGHVKHLSSIPGAVLGELYDPLPGQMESCVGAGAPSRHRSEEALLNSGADAIIIATPDELHAASLARVLDAGKHAFVEKPLATTSADLRLLRQLLEEARASGLVVSSCHPRRYDPPFTWLKTQLPGLIEAFGRPLSFEYDFTYHRPNRDWKQERGLLIDHANHEIDLLHFLFGHQPFSANRLVDKFDHYHVVGVRSDDLAFSFMGTRRLEAKKYTEGLRVRFERGELTLNTETGTARIINHESGQIDIRECGATNYEKRFLEVTKNFIEAIRGETENYLSPRDLFVNTAFGVELTESGSFSYAL